MFYNRFHNLDEVLEIVYKNAVYKMHLCINSEINPEEDFFGYILDVVINVLTATYDIKKQFARYAFEHDSLTEANYEWWVKEIKKIIDFGCSKGHIDYVDADKLSYSIWCFCRGFNADAIGRNISKEDAVECFRYGFGCFINGIRK